MKQQQKKRKVDAASAEEQETPMGMRRGLTSYGDQRFSLYLRKAFIKAMGYSDDAVN